MKAFSLCLSLVSIYLLTWLFSLFLEPQKACLESSVASGVEVTTALNQKINLSSCGPLHHFHQGDIKASEQAQLAYFQQSIDRVESVWHYVGGSADAPKVSINFRDPFAYEVRPGAVILGSEILPATGQTEKALVLSGLQSVYGGADRFLLEVVAEFYASLAIGEFNFLDPLTRERAYISGGNWLGYVQSFSDYCLSSLKSLTHTDYCEFQNNTSDVKADPKGLGDITVWGFRGFYSQAIWKIYSSLPLHEKVGFTRGFPQILKTVNLEYPVKIKELDALGQWALGFLLEVLGVTQISDLAEKVARISEDLGFNKQPRMAFVIDVQRSDQLNPQDVISSLDKAIVRDQVIDLLVETETGHHFFPGGHRVSFSGNDVAVDYWLLFQCGNPKVQDITKYQARKVVVIRDCDSIMDLNWNKLLQEGLAKFLRGMDRDFAVIHVNSLKYAVKSGNLKNNEKLPLESKTALTRRLRWKDMRWQKETSAFYPSSDINVITLIRFANKANL